MKSLSSHHLFFAGLGLLLATNAFILGGVIFNRHGTPTTSIQLTERELQLPYRIHEENSGLSLHLSWRTLSREDNSGSYSGWGSPAWFDREKLKEIGFSDEQFCQEEKYEASPKRPLPKDAFIVLEIDGKTYQDALKRAERKVAKEEAKEGDQKQEIKWAQERLVAERLSASRLIAIDAGLDPIKLRGKYPDTSHFLITTGQVRPIANYHDNLKTTYHGTITGLSAEDIHVPLSLRQEFMPLLKDKRLKDKASPRYQVVLAYGKRFEPWIKAVNKLAANQNQPVKP